MTKQREVIFITNHTTVTPAEYILTLCTMMETVFNDVTLPDKTPKAPDKSTDAA